MSLPQSAPRRRAFRRRRTALTIIATVALAMTAAGCGGDDTSTAKGKGLEQTTISVVVAPVVDSAPIYLGEQAGLFEAEGLTIEKKTFASGAKAVEALTGNQVDVAFGDYASGMLAIAAGKQLRIVGEASTSDKGVISVVVPSYSPIKVPADLKGKTIAVTSLTGTPTLIIDSALRVAGVDPSEVQYLELEPDKMGTALQVGTVDAGYVLEPFVTKLGQSMGAREILDPVSGATALFPLNGYMVTEEFATKNPKTVAAFQRALAKAQALATPAAIQQVVPTFTKIDLSTAALMATPTFPTSVNPRRIQRVADLLYQAKQIDRPLNVADFTIIPQS